MDALHLASAASEGAELITGDRALLRAAATLGGAIIGAEQQGRRRVPVAIETEVP